MSVHIFTHTYMNRYVHIYERRICVLLNSPNDDVYLEYYSGKGFHINYSVYMSYVKHINSSNKA
jgi:hypothetical protein